MNAQSEVDRLDRAYQSLTGHQFKASGVLTGREYAWSSFIRAGYSIRDLEVTIAWIKRGIQEGKRHEAALGFRRLIGDLMTFEDECSIANAERRASKPKQTPKEQVIAQARPIAAAPKVPENIKHVSELINDLKRAAGMI